MWFAVLSGLRMGSCSTTSVKCGRFDGVQVELRATDTHGKDVCCIARLVPHGGGDTICDVHAMWAGRQSVRWLTGYHT
jgi:hypothetical protein